MRLGSAAHVRIGISVTGDGHEARFLHGRGIRSGSVDNDAFSFGAMPSAAASAGRLIAGDVVIALRGTTNPATMIGEDVLAGPPSFPTLDVGIIRVNPADILPGYVAAVLNLQSTQATFLRARTGDVTPRLPLRALSDVDIPIPDLSHQMQVHLLLNDMDEEQCLLVRIAELRRLQINELLAGALRGPAEEAVPGSHPARSKSARGDRAPVS